MGYLNYFVDRVCSPTSETPTHILRVLLLQKTADLTVFFKIFTNQDPFLRVFLSQQWLILQVFHNFVKLDPLLRIFLTKMGPMSKDFW